MGSAFFFFFLPNRLSLILPGDHNRFSDLFSLLKEVTLSIPQEKAGIDAAERKQAYGLASRKHLALNMGDKQVTVEYQKRDRYGRIVGKVWINGTDACLEQVKAGFAWHYKEIPT